MCCPIQQRGQITETPQITLSDSTHCRIPHPDDSRVQGQTSHCTQDGQILELEMQLSVRSSTESRMRDVDKNTDESSIHHGRNKNDAAKLLCENAITEPNSREDAVNFNKCDICNLQNGISGECNALSTNTSSRDVLVTIESQKFDAGKQSSSRSVEEMLASQENEETDVEQKNSSISEEFCRVAIARLDEHGESIASLKQDMKNTRDDLAIRLGAISQSAAVQESAMETVRKEIAELKVFIRASIRDAEEKIFSKIEGMFETYLETMRTTEMGTQEEIMNLKKTAKMLEKNIVHLTSENLELRRQLEHEEAMTHPEQVVTSLQEGAYSYQTVEQTFNQLHPKHKSQAVDNTTDNVSVGSLSVDSSETSAEDCGAAEEISGFEPNDEWIWTPVGQCLHTIYEALKESDSDASVGDMGGVQKSSDAQQEHMEGSFPIPPSNESVQDANTCLPDDGHGIEDWLGGCPASDNDSEMSILDIGEALTYADRPPPQNATEEDSNSSSSLPVDGDETAIDDGEDWQRVSVDSAILQEAFKVVEALSSDISVHGMSHRLSFIQVSMGIGHKIPNCADHIAA